MGGKKKERTVAERRATVDEILLTQGGLHGGLKSWKKSTAAVLDALRIDLEVNEPYATVIIGALQDAVNYIDDDPLEDVDA